MSTAPQQINEWIDLGLAYSTGEGAPFDLVTAHKWLNLAAMAGDAEARRLRAELARDMTVAEIAEALRLARTAQSQVVH